MLFSGAWGKMIHEKTWSKKSFNSVPLTSQYVFLVRSQRAPGPLSPLVHRPPFQPPVNKINPILLARCQLIRYFHHGLIKTRRLERQVVNKNWYWKQELGKRLGLCISLLQTKHQTHSWVPLTLVSGYLLLISPYVSNLQKWWVNRRKDWFSRSKGQSVGWQCVIGNLVYGTIITGRLSHHEINNN